MNAKTYISNIVNEAVQKQKDNNLREAIRPMIANALLESIFEKEHPEGGHKGGKSKKVKVDDLVQRLMSNPTFKKKAIDYLTDDDAYDGWSKALKGKTYDALDNQSDGSKRRTVTQRLKDKKIDYAPIAYELWPSMSQDAARSWFSKKVDGRNESFTDEEISKIYNLLNNIMTE